MARSPLLPGGRATTYKTPETCPDSSTRSTSAKSWAWGTGRSRLSFGRCPWCGEATSATWSATGSAAAARGSGTAGASARGARPRSGPGTSPATSPRAGCRTWPSSGRARGPARAHGGPGGRALRHLARSTSALTRRPGLPPGHAAPRAARADGPGRGDTQGRPGLGGRAVRSGASVHRPVPRRHPPGVRPRRGRAKPGQEPQGPPPRPPRRRRPSHRRSSTAWPCSARSRPATGSTCC